LEVKIFFASANCLIDPSSGAARSVATFLSYLSRSGHECQTLTGSIYDKPLFENPIENIQANGAMPVQSEKGELNIWRQDIGGVQHLIFPTLISNRTFVPARDELKIFRHALTYLDLKKPDVFLTYGNGLLERSLLREARDRGIATRKRLFLRMLTRFSRILKQREPFTKRDFNLAPMQSENSSSSQKSQQQVRSRSMSLSLIRPLRRA
jgi:hypothetical protein